MILSNINILYLDGKEFKNVNELFDKGEGLGLGYSVNTITKLSLDESEELLYLEFTVNTQTFTKNYKVEIQKALSESNVKGMIEEGDLYYSLIKKRLEIWLPLASRYLEFGLKVENCDTVNLLVIKGYSPGGYKR